MAAVPYLACMLAVSHLYHLPPRVLPSIQVVEGGRPGMISPNWNGTGDLGVMQVNTNWVPRIADAWNLPPREVAARLIRDPCFNIASAGAIMRIYLDEAGGDLVRAVGYYHSHTPELASFYRVRVIRASMRLFGRAKTKRASARQPARGFAAGPRRRR
jgi:soluble lytic murein transglycosylase-like protein